MDGKIRPSVVFSNAPKSLANHSVPTWSVSLPEPCICCFNWLDPHSVQQGRKSFHPCRTLLFSLLPKKSPSLCVSLQIFLFHFDICHTISSELDGFIGNLDISFCLSTLLPCGVDPFRRILLMSHPRQAFLLCPYFSMSGCRCWSLSTHQPFWLWFLMMFVTPLLEPTPAPKFWKLLSMCSIFHRDMLYIK